MKSGRQPAPASSFTRDELRALLAPIALYPDPLLAQVLPASAYPVQIIQAQRWLDKNPGKVASNDFSWIEGQDWDPAVKALARFPTVMKKMSEDLDWTTHLGDAEVNQPQDVADVIQELRAEAERAGALKTTAQQTVVASSQGGQNVITIQPTDRARRAPLRHVRERHRPVPSRHGRDRPRPGPRVASRLRETGFARNAH